MTSLEEEIEKYRSLYNDIRSKYTILSADFEHQQIEHRDQIDSVQFNSNCRIRDAEKEKSDFKKQHGELKKGQAKTDYFTNRLRKNLRGL